MKMEEASPAMEIQRAALVDLRSLGQMLNELSDSTELANPEVQTVLARMQIAQLALSLPTAAIGACAIDGSPLTYRGRIDGLWVCCNADPEHCWKNSQV